MRWRGGLGCRGRGVCRGSDQCPRGESGMQKWRRLGEERLRAAGSVRGARAQVGTAVPDTGSGPWGTPDEARSGHVSACTSSLSAG